MIKKLSRREFLRDSALGFGAIASSAILPRPLKNFKIDGFPFLRNNKIARKAIVIGMDGLDPNLIRKFIEAGEMPTFKKIIDRGGHFGELQTTMPPHSPVAWSSFINGTNPGGTGIYDFVHRDPTTFTPYMSTSRSFDSGSTFSLGDWNIPLSAGRVELMRKGTPFWEYLERSDIPVSVFQIPANFPITPSRIKAVSGMGTPDLLGSYGTATLFSDMLVPAADKLSGSRVVRIREFNNIYKTALSGPRNSFRVENPSSEIPFTIQRDAYEAVIRIIIQDKEIILKAGEFSDWVPLKFEMVPYMVSVPGMVRFFAKQVHPKLQLYVSPINVDPLNPALPIASPADYSVELAQAVGRFYTQGFPADTKSLSNGLLSDDEYLMQAKIVLEENIKALEYQFNNFHEGLFFFYFSSTDQNQHMLSRLMDPTHPLYDPNASPQCKDAVKYFYRAMDEVLAKVLSKVDSSTLLIALSDHGFAPFVREFNLSTWLYEQGFTSVPHAEQMEEAETYACVDWSKTKAYALGINGLYLNLKDREKEGIVTAAESAAIKAEIKSKLCKVTDPLNGKPIITNVYEPKDIYSGPYLNEAPDLVVGYQRGYRISDESVLGKFPKEIVRDRTDKWSSDHCMDPAVVPGMLLSNQNCKIPNPGLWDMGPSILNSFGIETPKDMNGKAVLG